MHAVLLDTVGNGQRCGKADPARTTSPAFPHVAIPCRCRKTCCYPLVDVEPARNFNAPSLRNIEATEGKDMRNEGGPQL